MIISRAATEAAGRVSWRGAAVVSPALLGFLLLLGQNPIRQDARYHEFADARTVMGIDHFGDVATNLGFVAAGLLGLALLARGRAKFRDPRESLPYSIFFAGILLTGAGSTWYHLQPADSTLFWDRLPMAVSFMALFAAVVGERVSPRVGIRILAPLILAGIASVLVWRWGDDLRFYALVQFYPMIAIPVLWIAYPSKYTHASWVWILYAMYGAAKGFEILDRPVFDAIGILSGHNLKHLAAAAGAFCVVRMLAVRRPVPSR